MESETKCLDEIEAGYEVEYALRQEIHSKIGEILKLEHINAKHCREIARLRVGREKSVGELLSRIDDLKSIHCNDVETLAKQINNLTFELNIRNVPAMKESLKSSARLALAQEEEIERLNARISAISETTPDVSDESQDTVSDDKIDHVSECVNLFEYIKDLIVELSTKDGIVSINPGIIDPKYIESAVRYTMPGLFSVCSLLGDEDLKRIKFADVILDKFGIRTMAKYEELVERCDIYVATFDNRGSGDTVRKFR